MLLPFEAFMRLRIILPVLALFAMEPAFAAEASFAEAARRLNGWWADGEGFVLKIDSARAQANVDPIRPFQWQRFLVKDVAGDIIRFAIGPELFEAKIESSSLILTGTSFLGERNMSRGVAPDLRR